MNQGPTIHPQPGRKGWIYGIVAGVLLVVFCGGLLVYAQQKRRADLERPVYRTEKTEVEAPKLGAPLANDGQTTLVSDTQGVKVHPLTPFVKKTEELLKRIDGGVKDYSCRLVKRERINGVLSAETHMDAKIRHEQTAGGKVTTPFSVYLHFVAPDDTKGREVIWVKGHNKNQITAHDGGVGLIAALKSGVTVNLDPDSAMAMKGNKYPIYNIGMRNLLEKLQEEALKDMEHDEVELQQFKGTKINGRACTCFQAVHPVKRDHFRYHIVRVYIDDELQLPVRYEAHTWPTRQGGDPVLQEEYTYVDVQVNRGFTDKDFSSTNPEYRFK